MWVSRYTISAGIFAVDGWLKDPRVLGCHMVNQLGFSHSNEVDGSLG